MTKVTRLTLDSEGGLDRRRIHLREISDEMDAPLDTVGQDLRTARLRRGDDLATVSRALKIRKDHLEALEEDRVEALPGRTYAVGFIRSYADYLGLDSIQCVERFKAEIAGRSDATVVPITVIDEDAEPRMPHGWKFMAGVVVLLVLYGAYQLAASADRMLNEPTVAPAPVIQHPVRKAPPPKPVEQPQPVVVPPPADTSQQSDSTETVPGQAAPGQVAAGILDPSLATPPAQTQPSSGQPAFALPPLPKGQVYGDASKPARVVLRAREATRILVQAADGRVFQNRLLKPGDSYRLPNVPGLTLTTPNGGAIELDLDGMVVGTAGHSQETTEALSLDPQSIMDRYNGNRR
ncbi:cytoskeleton protein RodZ [Rhizomicrobium palustre]|uniref:Cytoskeleton protein RodZ n=1 Tax=Rhizomicrobium palustre TaxID=189966 RepID=A0A846N230_9PROT|nr:RodZ domain-containing protein [Rhizomicrobium palustre]NIK89998.1 cytoskeleton protein RodZ [Rhizomicrobium palustre]